MADRASELLRPGVKRILAAAEEFDRACGSGLTATASVAGRPERMRASRTFTPAVPIPNTLREMVWLGAAVAKAVWRLVCIGRVEFKGSPSPQPSPPRRGRIVSRARAIPKPWAIARSEE